MDDLESWSSLYCAGRMQKPIHFLRRTAAVDAACVVNLRAAMATALLLEVVDEGDRSGSDEHDAHVYSSQTESLSLSLSLSESQIYKRIAGLSYLADIRVGLGAEHPQKVSAIVDGNLEGCVFVVFGSWWWWWFWCGERCGRR